MWASKKTVKASHIFLSAFIFTGRIHAGEFLIACRLRSFMRLLLDRNFLRAVRLAPNGDSNLRSIFSAVEEQRQTKRLEWADFVFRCPRGGVNNWFISDKPFFYYATSKKIRHLRLSHFSVYVRRQPSGWRPFNHLFTHIADPPAQQKNQWAHQMMKHVHRTFWSPFWPLVINVWELNKGFSLRMKTVLGRNFSRD